MLRRLVVQFLCMELARLFYKNRFSLYRYNRKVAKISAWEKSMKSKAESNLRSLEVSDYLILTSDGPLACYDHDRRI